MNYQKQYQDYTNGGPSNIELVSEEKEYQAQITDFKRKSRIVRFNSKKDLHYSEGTLYFK